VLLSERGVIVTVASYPDSTRYLMAGDWRILAYQQ